ncbi:hypothetical protein O181_096801 [Austropuccinia psidii MF-1]|uniref:Integrase catalytic domain-containing protein n=1 Tax=Austropuccinia psidii MF-1 TaxID=1389203 RepID=A0A9Q3J848_9BASI|nr:hypothetical protein [Austropuccinia psidii MF-1]
MKKNIHNKKFGLLKPLPIKNGPWICLSMDFITQFPLSNSFDSILITVDRFSKIAVFISTMSSITSLDLIHLFIKNNFSNNGLTSSIVSDRGSLFVSSFWTNLCQQLKISRDLSTAYHPETDGQTERVNQILEQYHWMCISYHQDDWNTWLPLAEFAYNNADHSSTKQSLFSLFMEEILTLTQLTLLKILLLESYQKNTISTARCQRELEVAINSFTRYADKSRANPPVFNLGDMNSIHPVFPISLLEPVKTSKIQNRCQDPPLQIIGEEGEGNGKYLKSWTQSSREENYGIWCNGKASVKNQKDPLGNQLKSSRIFLNWLSIFILYILKSQDPIHQELNHLWAWWGEKLP